MEDCSDPVVAAFGKFRGDLVLDFDVLAPAFSTLLQHYGLDSPMLDLTSDFDVAIFFATHTYEGQGLDSCYRFVGTNDRKAVLYLLRAEATEMFRHERKRVLDLVAPQRPARQHCVVAGSAPWALNLPADFVVGVIQLSFDLTAPGRYGVADLFPSTSDDRFLAALISKNIQRVTAFRH